MAVLSFEELQCRIGERVGMSSWLVVDQAMIDAFADVTEDWQFIHTNPALAATSPFGTTIAHGFLTLSLLARMSAEVRILPEGANLAVNYGFDKVRFLAPVQSGKRVRGHFVLDLLKEKAPGQWLMRHDVTVEIEHQIKPALSASWLTLVFR